MAYEELEAIPRGVETPNIYGSADSALAVEESAMCGSVRSWNKYIDPITPRTLQSQIPIEIDWSNPLTKGLIAAIDPVSGTNLISKAPPTFSNAAKSVTKNGVAKVTIVNTSSYETYTFNRSTVNNACSYFVLCDYALPTGSPSTFILGDVEASGVGYNAGLYSNTGNFSFYVKNTSGIVASVTSTTTALSAINNLRLAGTYDGANIRVFVNGVNEASNGHTGNVGIDAFSLNFNRWNNYVGFGVSLNIGLVWNRALSNAEIKSISDNPWQIFRPIPRRISIPPIPKLPSKVGIPGLPTILPIYAQQPQTNVGINWNNPITKGLIFNINAATAQPESYVGSARRSVNTEGVSFDYVNPSSTYFPHIDGLIGPITIMTLVRPRTFSNYTPIITKAFGSTNVIPFDIRIGNDISDSKFYIARANTSTKTYYTNSDKLIANTDSIVAVTFSDGLVNTPPTIWYGKKGSTLTSILPENSTGTATGLVTDDINSKIKIGGVSSMSTGLNGNIYFIYIWNRVLSPAEIQAIGDNPWQIFKPLAHKQFVGNNTLPNIQVYREHVMQTTQPQIPVEIDWSNPITRGLVLAALPSHNAVNGSFPVVSGGSTRAVSKYGIGYAITSTGGSGAMYPLSGTVTIGTGNFTVLGCFATNAGSYTHTTDILGTCFQFGAEAAVGVPGVRLVTSATRGATGIVMAIRRGTGANQTELWQESGAITTGTMGSNLGAKTSAGSYYTASNGSVTSFPLMLAWTRDLSPSEASLVIANPWQIFKPITCRLPNITPKKPQPLLLTSKYFTQIPRYPIRISNNANVIAAVGVSDGIVWNGLTGEKITPNLPGAFWQDQFNTVSSGVNSAHVWSVPVNFKIHEPFTYVLVWRYYGGASGESGRQLFSIGDFNDADGFAFRAPDYNDYRRYYIQAYANYTGLNGSSFGDPSHIPYGTDVITVVRSTGLNGMLYISDNLGWSNVATGASITSAQYSGHWTRNIDFYTFKDWAATLGMFVMWNRALSDEECIKLTKQPYTVFNSPGYPARLK